MGNPPKIKLYLVDDDAVFLKSLEIDFTSTPYFEVVSFQTGEECLAALDEKPDIIILDYLLDGLNPLAMNGIQTLDGIKAKDDNIPVIMLSGQDRIQVAVDCMHHKAFDYIVKSETAFLRIERTIADILKIKKMKSQLEWYMDRM
ncbi:MAG: response regulator [Chitinophagaceae bacterium BSSC1]|nr:MAG: response regulator [Chitinophagaceae bacterium BSSC1]